MTADQQAPPRGRPGRRGPLLLVGAAVVAIVVVVLVRTLTASGSGPGSSPGSVARAWAEARLHHDEQKSRALECRGKHEELSGRLELLSLTASRVTGFRSTSTRSTGDRRWQVTLSTEPGGQSTFPVTVVRRHGEYLVCD